MFAISPKYRSSMQSPSILTTTKDPTPKVSSCNSFEQQDIKKKIETKISIMSQNPKSSIISDNGYNSSIYEWRKTQIAPIVKVVEIAKTSEIDPFSGLACTRNTVRPENIYCNLGTIQQFTKVQLLLILRNLIEGHQAIFKKMKATSVSLEKCVITMKGQVKVWVNQYFQRNDISGQVLSRQQEIVKRIFQIVSFLSSNNKDSKLDQFLQYVQSSVKKAGKWRFSMIKAMIKSYSDCLKIKIPQYICLNKNLKSDRKNVLSSMVQNQNNHKKQFLRSRLSSFQSTNPNVESSFNFVQHFRRKSLLTSKASLKQSNELSMAKALESLAKNPTSKSIHQKQTSSTLKSLNSRTTKHTSSVSALMFQKDVIKQKEGYLNNDSKCKLNNSKQKRNIPSINNILTHRIGITPLFQSINEEMSSDPSAKKNDVREIFEEQDERKNQFNIVSQFNLVIQKPPVQYHKNSKQSSISTTNQTSISGNQFCFSKKTKDSNITINFDENKDKDIENKHKPEQFRTASRDRFKQTHLNQLNTEPKKVVGSCTNWANHERSGNVYNLNSLLQKIHISKIIDRKQEQKTKMVSYPTQNLNTNSNPNSNSKLNLISNQNTNTILNPSTTTNKRLNQVLSIKTIYNDEPQKTITPLKSCKNMIKQYLKNPLTLLNQLKSEQELQSFEHTQHNSQGGSSHSPSMRKIKVPIQQKIIQLLNLNKRLVVSTYMQSNSEKKLDNAQVSSKSPLLQSQKKLKQIEQTLSQLVRANLRQQQILQDNCWTKKLQNLLGIQQKGIELKESISFGQEEATALLREIKLSRLGKWGRDIGKSVIPE